MDEPVIEISDLTKFYGRTKGIDHINLEIGRGDIFGFIGPNGAGKSTTIRILLNLIFPTSGSAKILGMDVIRKTREIKKRTGYIPSDANPYSYMDVEEFLNYCARFYDAGMAVKRISELAGIFDLDLKRKISDLSLGNRKKVSIIQSLLHSPDVLIMDEPTTGLDPLMQSVFFELLRAENKKGVTIFFSSHNLAEVQMFCRTVAIVREGKIIQVEDIESLRKKQLKKVTIEFSSREESDSFTVGDAEKLTRRPGNTISFMYSGKINDLVNSFSGKGINNLMIEEPSLEEIFMHYYKS